MTFEDDINTTDEGPLMIRRAPNACCPDCQIHNGYCYEMHETIMNKYKQKVKDAINKELSPHNDCITCFHKESLLRLKKELGLEE